MDNSVMLVSLTVRQLDVDSFQCSIYFFESSPSVKIYTFYNGRSIEANSATNGKQAFKYIVPAVPSKLLDSMVFVLNFTNHKFVHFCFNFCDSFNIAIHIISLRFINIRPQFVKQICSLMGKYYLFYSIHRKNATRVFSGR